MSGYCCREFIEILEKEPCVDTNLKQMRRAEKENTSTI
jgi:hypothetical protein